MMPPVIPTHRYNRYDSASSELPAYAGQAGFIPLGPQPPFDPQGLFISQEWFDPQYQHLNSYDDLQQRWIAPNYVPQPPSSYRANNAANGGVYDAEYPGLKASNYLRPQTNHYPSRLGAQHRPQSRKSSNYAFPLTEFVPNKYHRTRLRGKNNNNSSRASSASGATKGHQPPDVDADFRDAAASKGIRISRPSPSIDVVRADAKRILAYTQSTADFVPTQGHLYSEALKSIIPPAYATDNAPQTRFVPAPPVNQPVAVGLVRMRLPMRPVVAVPKSRFSSSKFSIQQSVSNNCLLSLSRKVKDLIWTHVIDSFEFDGLRAPRKIVFDETGGIVNLPPAALTPKTIVQFLNRFTVSKSWYKDATSVFFTKFLPNMVSEVHDLESYEMLEKYVLWDCPQHFVRFCWFFHDKTRGLEAIHLLQLRTMTIATDQSPLTYTGNYRLDTSMEKSARANGFLPSEANGEDPKCHQAFAWRPPQYTSLSLLTVDGEIGNIYWWIHAYYNHIFWNRVHWLAVPSLFYDFINMLKYHMEVEGVLFRGKARFGCVMTATRTCKYEAERDLCNSAAETTLKHWKDSKQL
jgi:hypothetical protein